LKHINIAFHPLRHIIKILRHRDRPVMWTKSIDHCSFFNFKNVAAASL